MITGCFNTSIFVCTDPPRITQPPMAQVVPLPENTFDSQGASITFTCTATATTDLEIFWFHGEEEADVSRRDPDKYTTEDINRGNDGGLNSVSNRLQINFLTIFDGGVVRCEARIPASVNTGGEPAAVTEVTTVTVLGKLNHLHVPSVL